MFELYFPPAQIGILPIDADATLAPMVLTPTDPPTKPPPK